LSRRSFDEPNIFLRAVPNISDLSDAALAEAEAKPRRDRRSAPPLAHP
jgi:hypothetical protein